NHRAAEGRAPAGGVEAERVGGDHAFTGGCDPNDLVAVVGETRRLVLVVGRSDAHYVLLPACWIDHFVFAFVTGRSHQNHVIVVGILEGVVELGRLGRHVELYVDNVPA